MATNKWKSTMSTISGHCNQSLLNFRNGCDHEPNRFEIYSNSIRCLCAMVKRQKQKQNNRQNNRNGFNWKRIRWEWMRRTINELWLEIDSMRVNSCFHFPFRFHSDSRSLNALDFRVTWSARAYSNYCNLSRWRSAAAAEKFSGKSALNVTNAQKMKSPDKSRWFHY